MLLVVILAVGHPQDALFGIILVSNALIGIVQEVRAKRTLDQLAVLNEPRARVVRDGRREVAVDEVVLDDLIELRSGDQIAADGIVRATDGLEVDESLLTGESDPVDKATGDEVLSGSFVVAGSGRFQATAVGDDAYARKLATEARRFALGTSELVDGINRILRYVTWALFPVAVLLLVSQFNAQDDWRGRSTAVAGVVGMVPEGLVLLTSVAFGVAAVTLARRKVLVQELPAVEGWPGSTWSASTRPARSPTGTSCSTRRAARRSGAGRGRARGARVRREPQRDAERDRGGVPDDGLWATHRGRAVLVGTQVERGDLRRPRHVGARRARDGVGRATTAEVRAEGRRRASRGSGCCSSRDRARRSKARAFRRRCIRRPRAARGAGPSRRRRDPRVLRAAGRGVEGHLRRQPRTVGAVAARVGLPAPIGRSTPASFPRTSTSSPRCSSSTPCSVG